MEKINASIDFDQRLYKEDIAGSKAHCKMLVRQEIISQEDGAAILAGLFTLLGVGGSVLWANLSLPYSESFEGATFGVYRERDELLPIVARAPAAERVDVTNIRNIQIFSPTAGRSIPLRQVVSGFETVFEDE